MSNGDEKLFKTFYSGELIDEMTIFTEPCYYSMTAKVDEESTIISFSNIVIKDIVFKSPILSMQIIIFMSNRIQDLLSKQTFVTPDNESQRVVMRLSEIYNDQKNKSSLFSLPMSKDALAEQLSMRPENFSKIINNLKNQQVLDEKNNRFLIKDIPLLCQSVGLPIDIFNTSK